MSKTRPTSGRRPGGRPNDPDDPSSPIRELLLVELRRLHDVKQRMVVEGLNDEAASLETSIADLEWQCSELGGK